MNISTPPGGHRGRVLRAAGLLAFLPMLLCDRAEAALLAHEPFANAPGAALIGSADGFGFSGAWQNYNSSLGTATNTATSLGYTDGAGWELVTSGGAGFFRGLTTANSSLQPIRRFDFSRGADGTTTWISFLALRQGPSVTGNNPYPRGANVPHDLDAGDVQKLAIGNSTGAATNTVSLIPLGSSGNIRPSQVVFSQINFIVVRVDHVAGANDNAYLFLNPALGVEPSVDQADANSLGAFDFSFDRVRVFAGGNDSGNSRPYAELVIDEYRLGETYADVTPYTQPGSLVITNTMLMPGSIVLSGTGGSSNAPYHLLANSSLDEPSTNWPAIATSGTLYLRGGTYAQPTKLSLNRSGVTDGAIRVWAYPGESPVIDSRGNSSDGVSISGSGYHLKGLTVINAGHNGINISGHHNTVENCVVHDNGNTGLHITGSNSGTTFPAYNLILNCDAYLNYDPPIGGNADGFSAKWDLGPGNEFRGCRAWWNSDDGWDLWMGNDAVVIDQCWAFSNGTNYWNSPQFDGNGQGFKLGGNYVGAPHRLTRSVAFDNEANGIDQNNNVAGQTVENNTCWANFGRNINLNHNSNNAPTTGDHRVRNNLSFAGGNNDTFWPGTVEVSNSWQVIASPSANAADVQSVDASVAAGPRNPDGPLPDWPFLRPVPAGRLVDQGVDVGLPFNGPAPDLGAFESRP